MADQMRDEITTGEILVPAPRAPQDTIESAAAAADPVKPRSFETAPEGVVPAGAEPAAPVHAHDVDPDEISYASLYTVTAATRPGGLKRGNLAVLIRYWTRGEGRAKIRFGTGGDFNRCLRHLSKYVPPNEVQGFCARLHKIATGQWPGRGRHH
jgi:hypothetical protein